jgi:putative transposase
MLGRDLVTERRACRVLGQARNTQRRKAHRNHVCSYDFVMDRTADGRVIRMLTIVDEFTRECLAIDVARKLTSEDVLERLSDLFVRRDVTDRIRSDNGSEFTAKRVREWLERVGVKTLYIEPGSPWENGYVESFNGKLRDEFLAREVFDTLLEAKVLIERWRKAYNTVRPHRSLGHRPRLRSRVAPVRSLRLRLSKRTGAIPWQGYPGDGDWFHSWGQIRKLFEHATGVRASLDWVPEDRTTPAVG